MVGDEEAGPVKILEKEWPSEEGGNQESVVS